MRGQKEHEMFFSYTILFLLQPPPHHMSLVSRLQTGWAWQRLSGCVPTTRGCPGCVRKGAEVPTTDAVLPFPLVTGHWGHQEMAGGRLPGSALSLGLCLLL